MLTSSQFLSDDLIAHHEFLEPLFFWPSPCNSKISCFLDGRLMSVNFRLIKGRFAIFHFNLLKTEHQSWSKSEFQSLPPKSHHSLGHFFFKFTECFAHDTIESLRMVRELFFW